VFLFTFLQGKRKALEEGPWWAGKDLIVLEDFEPTKLTEDYQFCKVPICCQISRIPFRMMDQITERTLGRELGRWTQM
jgi:hypothetical protein